jgi:hypothetical protein
MSQIATRIFGSISGAGRTFTETTGISYMVPIIAALVIIVVITIAVIVIIQYKAKRPARELMGPIQLFNPESPVIVDRPTVSKVMTNSYTLSMYFKLDSVPDMRTDVALLAWPSVWALNYNPAQEELVWVFNQTQTSASSAPETVRVKNIPLQRWNQVVITFEGRTADVYCNGTLISSTTLNNITPLPNSSITIVPSNVNGTVAYIQVWPRRLTVGDVGSNYVETSDSQGRPYLGYDFFKPLLKFPNLFCPSGQCAGSSPKAGYGLTWEFPYR